MKYESSHAKIYFILKAWEFFLYLVLLPRNYLSSNFYTEDFYFLS